MEVDPFLSIPEHPMSKRDAPQKVATPEMMGRLFTKKEVKPMVNKDSARISQEELDALTAPFSPDELEFRPINISKDGTKAMPFAYINPRSAMQRMESVFPGEWELSVEHLPQFDGKRVITVAQITVRGISRTGTGESDILYTKSEKLANEPWKSSESDAIKRALMAWGVGQYLYSAPKLWLEFESNDYGGGKFKVDVVSQLFNEDGSVKTDAVSPKGKPGPKPAGKGVPSKAAPPVEQEPEAEEEEKPKVPAKGKASVPAKGAKQQAASNDGITPAQVTWITTLYTDAEMEAPADLESWTRKQAAQHMYESLEGDEKNKPATVAQLDLIAKLSDQLGEDIPDDLSFKVAGKMIQEMIAKAGKK
jgi:hypothetical protein